MSFKTEVEDYLGITFADTTALDTWLSTGARIYIDRMAIKEETTKPAYSKLELYATVKADGGSGIDITGGRPIGAHKANYKAGRVDYKDKALYADSDSMYFAVATDPIWYSEVKKAYVLPGGGTISWVAYPSVTNGGTSVSNFPPEGYAIFVLYATIQAQMQLVGTLLATTMAGITFSVSPVPVAPSAPSFTYTNAVGAVVALSAVSLTESFLYIPPVFGGGYTNIQTALDNHDVELAKGYATKLQTQLGEYNTDLQEAYNAFGKTAKETEIRLQKGIVQAQIEVQEAIKQAELTTNVDLQNKLRGYQKEVEEYQAKTGIFQTEVQLYSAQITQEIQRIQAVIGQHTATYQGYFVLLKHFNEEYNRLLETI